MIMLAWLDGRWQRAQEAHWPLLDRGLLFGDAVIETLRVDVGRARFAALHRARLQRSLRGVRLPVAAALADFDAILSTLPKAPAVGALRVMATAGAGETLHDRAGETRVFALLRERAAIISLRVKSSRAQLGTSIPSAVKHPGYLGAVALRTRGFDEVLVRNAAGRPCELTTANIFAVKKGVLLTPPLSEGILPGVTRSVVLQLAARLKIPSQQRDFPDRLLLGADELFATSSLRGVCPIVRLDHRRLRLGAITRALQEAYEARARVS